MVIGLLKLKKLEVGKKEFEGVIEQQEII